MSNKIYKNWSWLKSGNSITNSELWEQHQTKGAQERLIPNVPSHHRCLHIAGIFHSTGAGRWNGFPQAAIGPFKVHNPHIKFCKQKKLTWPYCHHKFLRENDCRRATENSSIYVRKQEALVTRHREHQARGFCWWQRNLPYYVHPVNFEAILSRTISGA